ncbi:MAG: glycosyltransferase family 87 protein, partial [Methylococcales bacterium]|nr:glycosyltransferase family 87 protein [Methylococcales bacterium]
AWFSLISLYLLLCYFALSQEWGLDFASYYGSSHALAIGHSPYQSFKDFFLDIRLSPSPNPPLTLLLFSIFSEFDYPVAFTLWLVFSTSLGGVAALKGFRLLFNQAFYERYRMTMLLLYLAAFPVLMNTIMLQWGGVLLYLFIEGYAGYLKQDLRKTRSVALKIGSQCSCTTVYTALEQREHRVGFFWGLLIALKLFPGLLLIYVLLKRQYRIAFWMLIWTIAFSAMPLFWVDSDLYYQYVHFISQGIPWYGVNWNISLRGFLFRCLVVLKKQPGLNAYTTVSGVLLATRLYHLGALLTLCAWIFSFKRLEQRSLYRGMSFLIVLMFFLSPMGWLYYGPLLLLPLGYTFCSGLR